MTCIENTSHAKVALVRIFLEREALKLRCAVINSLEIDGLI